MTDFEPIHLTYAGFDRKPCEVDVDGTWYAGEIRAWDRDEDGAWSANVAWTRGPGQSTYLERFPTDRVRALRLGPALFRLPR
ncbi:MAG: hypothetical protein ACRDO2_00310 [Nocardioidaceae bacterium]